MIAVIRISGAVKIPKKIDQALYRLRLRRKYTLTLVSSSKENLKLLNKIRNYIAYGSIDKETLKSLIDKRAEAKNKQLKINSKSVIAQLEKIPISKLEIKPFFRLHPPIGGIDSKKHFGVTKKGVLGDNKSDINKLIRRML